MWGLAFELRVCRTAGCWLWGGPVNKDGYGTLNVRDPSRNSGWRSVLAHRHAYEVAVGPIPPGLKVRHHCDTPACVRPDHLIAGTQKQNVDDCVRRGRRSPQAGAANHAAKLSRQQVAEIRQLRGLVSQSELALRYGVSQATIGDIIRGRSWAA